MRAMKIALWLLGVIAVVFITATIILALNIIKNDNTRTTNQPTKLPERFVKISEEKAVNLMGSAGYVVYDKETKIEYFMSTGPSNIGNLSILYNPSGFPLLYEGEE